MSEDGNFGCYQVSLSECPEKGDSTIFNTVMGALHELNRVDEEAKRLADNAWFSKDGKLERLAPLQEKVVEEVARQQKKIAGFEADLAVAEDRLLLPPAIEPSDAVSVSNDRERREWFASLSANERTTIEAEMRNGAHDDLVVALARGPTPVAARGLGREIWRARVQQKRQSEVRALAARRQAIAWAGMSLQTINKYAAVNPWSNRPAETPVDKMNRGRPSQPSA
jgi:hypothetical protein